MKITSRRQSSGFTLVEIMIVVAIIALLASIAVPSFLRARKRSMATDTMETLRMLDAAKDQWAIENGKVGAGTVAASPYSNADLLPYVKAGTKLYAQLAANHASDCFGRDIAINSIDQPPQITHQTWDDLASALGSDPSAFWGPYTAY